MVTDRVESRRDLLGMCLSELIGTALLLAVGLSAVIFDLGSHSPLATVLPSEAARRALTGLAFGATGMTIALSRVGRVSGAHLNPIVSLAFWLEGALPSRAVLPFVSSQLLGAVLGTVPLLAWATRGESISYGATAPGSGGLGLAFLGETATTFVLVICILSFVGHRRLRRYTPGIFPILYAVMVWLEAPWSGTSTNPARSLGPDVVSLAAHSYWLYWAAPVLGMLLALVARRFLPVLRHLEVDIAKLAHFESDTFARRRTGRRARPRVPRRSPPRRRRSNDGRSPACGPASSCADAAWPTEHSSSRSSQLLEMLVCQQSRGRRLAQVGSWRDSDG